MINGYDRAFRMASIVVLALVFWKLKGCERRGDVGEATETATELVARPDVAEAVVVKAGSVAVAKKGKKPSVRFVPPEGRVDVVLKTDGTLDVDVKDSGFAFSLGLAPVVSMDGVGRIGLMGKAFYKGRWGLEAGFLFGKRPFVVPAGGVSYQPAWRLRNTALMAAYSAREEIYGGILVRF